MLRDGNPRIHQQLVPPSLQMYPERCLLLVCWSQTLVTSGESGYLQLEKFGRRRGASFKLLVQADQLLDEKRRA